MIPRSLLLLLFGTACSFPSFAFWSDPFCEDAISYQTYLRQGKNFHKYELMTSGKDAGKYKPVYYVEVTAEGPCKGKYANPCGQVRSAKRENVRVSPGACDELKALYGQRKAEVVPGRYPDELPSGPERDRWEPITEGPDAYKGAYKPKYYVLIDSDLWKRSGVQAPPVPRPESRPYLGFYSPPNNHYLTDTVVADTYLAKRLGKLIRHAK